MGPVPSEISSQVNSGGDVLAYLKAGLDDGEGQHADARHRPGPRPQQHGLASVGGSLLKEALLQGVEGAEVDAHAGDAAQEGLPGLGLERLCYWGTSSRGSGGGGVLTGETPRHRLKKFSVRTTLRKTVNMPTFVPLWEETTRVACYHGYDGEHVSTT